MLSKLGVPDVPIFLNYFIPFGGRVSISTFIEFICVFTFYPCEVILPLLYSLANIKSNIFITEEQIYTLFKSIKASQQQYEDLEQFLSTTERRENGFVDISQLTTFITCERILFYSVYTLKAQIIKTIIGYEEFTLIERRRLYFYDSEIIGMPPPKEDCLGIMKRHFVTHKPPPYYYNYSPYVHKQNVEDIVFSIRQRYGYSIRPCRQSSSNINTSTSLARKSAKRKEKAESLSVVKSKSLSKSISRPVSTCSVKESNKQSLFSPTKSLKVVPATTHSSDEIIKSN